jgi:VCBS repeat-containing protein
VEDSGVGFITTETAILQTPSVLSNDLDPDPAESLSVESLDISETWGQVSHQGDGSFLYDPAGNYASLPQGELANDFFTYTVMDGSGLVSTGRVHITIQGENSTPTASSDELTIMEHEGTSLIAAQLLANDSDPDLGDKIGLSIHAVDTNGCRGTVIRLGGDLVTYNPTNAFGNLAAGTTTTDSFTYSVQDTNGSVSEPATVTIILTGQNDTPTAETDTVEVQADCGQTNLTELLLVNDHDPDPGETALLRVTHVEADAPEIMLSTMNGIVLFNSAGQFDSLTNGETASYEFTYEVQDPQGATAQTSVSLLIRGTNDAPKAVADEFQVDRDVTHTNLTAFLLANDFDPDTDETAALVVSGLVTDTTLGRVILTNQSVLYTPNAPSGLGLGQSASDQFTYTVRDPNGRTASATVTILVIGKNDPPLSGNDMVVLSNQAPPTNLTAQLLANDTDPNPVDSGTLGISGVLTNHTQGRVTLANGELSYSANGQFNHLALGATETDTFLYAVRDGSGAETIAGVTVTIVGSPAAPTLDSCQMVPGTGIKLEFAGQRGLDYVVLASSNLVHWIPLGSATEWAAGKYQFVDSAATNQSARFYQLRAELAADPIITSISERDDGVYRLGFAGSAGSSYRIFTSTNLLDWTPQGTAESILPGIFQFLDYDSTNYPARFYKLSAP